MSADTAFGGQTGAGHPGPVGDVAIIGMACIFPGAPNLEAYWQNIASGVDAIIDVPPGRWDPEVFFDPDPAEDDKLYCKRGGYLGDLAQFNPLEYGIMPKAIDGGEPEQLLSLRVAHEALADAGYADRPFNRERTEVIVGHGSYVSRGHANRLMHTLGIDQTLQVLRGLHPEYTVQELAAIKRELKASLPAFGPDTAGSMIPNLTTGRVANRLDLMGTNFTVDAACASALIATDLATRDLIAGRCDLALVGAVHLATHVPFLSVFCHLGALSRQSQIRPFDQGADGTLPGEGTGFMVLKRRDEAERDGDRIYAVIKGVGTSSDGRGQGPFAPRVEGEELALRRAYEAAGIPPETIELIEAHGTGTPVGDLAEIQALSKVFGLRKGRLPTCAVGTVKSMIGHLMPAAGIAGLIKTTLALYHKVLPPSLHCETPNPTFELEKTPFYINTETRPWIHGRQDTPRRAGVNAFGFGGVNAHVVLEEHVSGAENGAPRLSPYWETEVCLVQGASRQDLVDQARRLERYLDSARDAHLKDLAYTLNTDLREGSLRLAVVASSPDDLRQKLSRARQRLEDPTCRQIKDVQGLYFFEESLRRNGKLAFLFPGEASQYPNMLKDLCLHFPEVRAVFDSADQYFIKKGRPRLPSQSIFPVPGSSEAERLEQEGRLWEMGGAMEAILTANWALYTLLSHLEIRPDTVLGHSAGEYSALVASGILPNDLPSLQEYLFTLSATSERLTAEGKVPEAALAAIATSRRSVAPLIEGAGGELYVSNDNCPHQVVIAGREDAVEKVIERLRAEGVVCQRLPVDRAYHTPMFTGVTEVQKEFLRELPVSRPEVEIYSCSQMAPYPRDLEEIRELVGELWSRPVEFTGSIEAMYDAGVRIFVEVGPRGNLTAFVEDILRGRPHLAFPCDVPWRSSITQLNHLIGLLAAQGVDLRLDYLYERRSPTRLSLEHPARNGDGDAKPSGHLTLALDLPTMRLSPERIRSLAPQSPVPVDGLRFAPAGQEGQRPTGTAPGLGTLTPFAEPLGRFAFGPAGPDKDGALSLQPDVTRQVMLEHLHTMGRFLAVEQQIMEEFLDGSGDVVPQETGETPPVAAAPFFPFIGTIVSLIPGQEAVIRRRIDLDQDLFLQDHRFGGRGSDTDQSLEPLSVMPFTMCMEIMAEAAALLMPGKVLTAMRQIEVRQWIEADTPIALEITARRTSGEEVNVQIKNLGNAPESEAPAGVPTAEGTAIFGDAYPQPPPIVPLSLTAERPCQYTAKRMYEERLMFHGPRFQGVASLEGLGRNGIVGQLQVLPQTDLFKSTTAPDLLTDPVLLDAAAQPIGPWAVEHLDAGYVLLPFRLSALELYGPHPRVSERVRFEVEIRTVTPQHVGATINLFDADGRIRVRLVDWEDWRFFMPRALYDYLRFPKRYLLSSPWDVPISRLPRRETFVCQRLDPTPEHIRSVTMRTVAHTLLSRAERLQWPEAKGAGNRRAEWLFGRAAAKDAVRRILKGRDDINASPADIEIDHDQDGRPFVRLLGLGESAIAPSISIAHSDGIAVAIAGHCSEGDRLGIDIERIRPRQKAFQEIAFHADELTLLDAFAGSARDEWVTRLWCAKEATAKALGKGLLEGPRSLTVRKVDATTGTLEVVLGDRLAREFPELAGVPLVVYTAREEDWAVASTVCEKRSP